MRNCFQIFAYIGCRLIFTSTAWCSHSSSSNHLVTASDVLLNRHFIILHSHRMSCYMVIWSSNIVIGCTSTSSSDHLASSLDALLHRHLVILHRHRICYYIVNWSSCFVIGYTATFFVAVYPMHCYIVIWSSCIVIVFATTSSSDHLASSSDILLQHNLIILHRHRTHRDMQKSGCSIFRFLHS